MGVIYPQVIQKSEYPKHPQPPNKGSKSQTSDADVYIFLLFPLS
jgi:hypothetical protein